MWEKQQMRKQEIILNEIPLTVFSDNLEKKEDGTEYPKDCYSEANEEGFYLHDEAKYQKHLSGITKEKNKEVKEKALNNLYVEVNGVKYDAHKDAIANMNATVTTANSNMFKLISIGTEASIAYESVFKIKINWKGYDDKPHNVQIESIAEALNLAIRARGEIYGV
jgi:hypothetical protein